MRKSVRKNYSLHILIINYFSNSIQCPESSATGMGQFPICKLKWDLLKTSVTACTIDKNAFSAPFGISYMRTEIWKEFFLKSHIQPPNGVYLVFKLPFPNGSYRNGVCRGLWALSFITIITWITFICYSRARKFVKNVNMIQWIKKVLFTCFSNIGKILILSLKRVFLS